jgi:hypothetical protein
VDPRECVEEGGPTLCVCLVFWGYSLIIDWSV